MRKPTAVLDLDVASPAHLPRGLERFGDARILVKLHGSPVAFAKIPIVQGRLDSPVLRRHLVNERSAFVVPLVRMALDADWGDEPIDFEKLIRQPRRHTMAAPLVTVAVCTRDRTADLAMCLDGLTALDYPNLETLVVDNDPSDDATERLVRVRYPAVRYVREPRPGLNWARNRAVLECRGEFLAFTDDDVVADRRWIGALVDVFEADPSVMAVTGLVIPHELETDAQRLFEAYGGFGRGFVRRWYRAPAGRPLAMVHGGTGKFGTGANMAYRRTLFDHVGGFDPALDVGTCTNGGGDLEMFFRVLKAGHTLVYAPAAIVCHRHRRSYAQLRTQIENNGIGFSAYVRRSFHAWPDERQAFVNLGLWWFRWWHLRRLLRSFAGKERVPRDLIVTELLGSFVGITRYPRAAARAAEIAVRHADALQIAPRPAKGRTSARRAEAIRTIDIAGPLESIDDATEYERLRVIVFWRREALGSVSIDHHGAVVSAMWLADAIAHQLAGRILDGRTRYGAQVETAKLAQTLAAVVGQKDADEPGGLAALPNDASVSIVVATRDRPAGLRRCLGTLVAQRTGRRIEIIVVDNSAAGSTERAATTSAGASGDKSDARNLTAAVVREFPDVVLVTEPRAGLSYARNRGIAAATGDIIVTTDDDVTCPPDWIERLVAPFARADVMVVTGNVLPAQLDREAQRLFESYGGLGRGFTPLIADRDWFSRGRRAVPTWKLGCTANAAFRARIFADREIGLMDEALGAGTPTGCSEDTYAFYRVLKAGYTIVYEPSAIVWHHHRQSLRALQRQIFGYSKGHVAYQLTTWMVDGDRRALVRIAYELPRAYLRRAWLRLRRRSDYPLTFIGLEVLGCLAGPFALWRSRRRVRRLGRSGLLTEGHSYGVEPPRAEVTEA